MLVRRIAYPLLAAVFVANGVDTILNLKQKVEQAKPLVAKGQEALPLGRAVDAGTVVQAEAAAKIGAGLLLGFGRMPRLAATVLAATVIPSTLIEAPFWSSSYPDERKARQATALKNAGLLGGLLLAMVDTKGKPSIAHKAKKGKKAAAKVSKKARKRAKAG